MKLIIIACLALLSTILVISCQSNDELEFGRYYSTGRIMYLNKCQNCHGAKGDGLLALIPPLTDSSYLKTNRHYLACFVKYGLTKPLNISGKPFENQMPATDMAPIEIAEVLTFITNSFGNKLGVVTSQEVNEDLAGCR